MAAQIKGVLIDVDGTLLDSNEAHALSWQEALKEHGHQVEVGAIRPLIGKGGDKVLQELADLDAESAEGQAISQTRVSVFAEKHLSGLRPTHGARALIEGLKAAGLQLIIATSSTDKELRSLLQKAGVDDLLEVAATSDDAKASKPDPDIVQAALKKAGLQADQVFMLGDTPHDVSAAAAAQVPTVALRCGGHWDDSAFAGAAAVFDDPADLLAHLRDLLFDLPQAARPNGAHR